MTNIIEGEGMSIRRRVLGRLNRVPLIDRHIYVARHGPARGLKRQGGMGWLPSFVPRMHEWEAEEAFLADLDWKGLTVYDVGGDQGLFTLFFADRVGETGRVVVIEPNPQSCNRIAQNVGHNNFRNVRVVPVGLADRKARLQFAFPSSQPARGSAVPDVADQIRQEGQATLCEIEVNTLDDEIKRSTLPPPHFIKIDVEGMEFPALQGMRMTLQEHRPRLSIEIHGLGAAQKAANVRQVVAFLEEIDYRLWHIESDQSIETSNAVRAMEGHLYCEPL